MRPGMSRSTLNSDGDFNVDEVGSRFISVREMDRVLLIARHAKRAVHTDSFSQCRIYSSVPLSQNDYLVILEVAPIEFPRVRGVGPS